MAIRSRGPRRLASRPDRRAAPAPRAMTERIGRPPPLTTFGPPAPRKPLTQVQEEIAKLLASGSDLDHIAGEMGMHASTVKYHITQTARTLNLPDCEDLTDREQVLVWAFWTYRQGAA